MAIYLKIDDRLEGPLTEPEIRGRLERGAISLQTPAWTVGMAEWKTVRDFLPGQAAANSANASKGPPPLPPRGSPPPPLPKAPPPLLASQEECQEAMEAVQNFFGEGQPLVIQPDALQRLGAARDGFLSKVGGLLGQVARPNETFYAYRVAMTAIQRLRLDLLNGARLTPSGEEFAGLAAAYLASLAAINWRRRGLSVSGSVKLEPGARDHCLFLIAERSRNGALEVYSQDFLADMRQVLLTPPKTFPSMHGRYFIMDSLTLPSPEYIYQYAVHLMQSQRSGGNWPQGQRVGGLEEDFSVSRELLVNDLHHDCGLPSSDPALRKLSWWIVFPPFGWDMNDGQDYNMMTVFDQVSSQRIVPLDVATDYLRALLRSQSLEIRNLAARCLMVYRVPPRDALESAHYHQAMRSRDWDFAAASMARYQSQLEQVENTPAWREQVDRERQDWLKQIPPVLSERTAAENDPEYIALSKLPEEKIAEGIAGLESLLRRYPNDWILKVLHASQRMRGPDPAGGERALRDLIENPANSSEGHSRLGTLLKQQGRRPEAMQVYREEVRRWPWNYRAVDSCLWLITDGMTQF